MMHKATLTEDLIDTICDDADDLVDFLQKRSDLEHRAAEKVSKMSEEEFRNTWTQYITYQSIEDAISNIDDESE